MSTCFQSNFPSDHHHKQARDSDIQLPLFPIRRATVSDFEAVWNILEACNRWFLKHGLKHWENAHPPEVVREFIVRSKVFVLRSGDSILGTVKVDRRPPVSFLDTDFPDTQIGLIVAIQSK